MTNDVWRSLRSRILLLAVLTCLFLGIAAFSLSSFLRNSQAASISASERHLAGLVMALAQSYLDRTSDTPSLQSAVATSVQAGPSPPLDAPGPPPPPPDPPWTNDPLVRLTANTLERENGIEGGFYTAASDALVGYAFPTHEGPGPKKALPQRERPTIERLVRQAVASGSLQSFRFEGPHDAVLFVATPIRERRHTSGTEQTEVVTGAAWLMQRIPGFNGAQNRQLLITSLGFGTAAVVTALLAFFVTTEVRGGVNTVLVRLRSLEEGLGKGRSPSHNAPLKEFQQVLDGIDTLARTLDQKIEQEKTLEAELRHRERLSSLGQFAAGVAHELRNPLATVRLRTQMSQRSANPDAIARNSRVILEEVDRLDAMIERLLSFSRPITLGKEWISVEELCSSLAASWQERAFPVRVCSQSSGGLMLACDRSRIIQVLDNLVENAVESVRYGSGSGGLVELNAIADGSTIVISVSDNGRGFANEALKHALDPFFTTRDSGTGLGLSIASELVQAHGGWLSLRNRPEGGAVVSASIPDGLSRTSRPDMQEAALG